MKFCIYCGKEIVGTEKYCIYCGHELRQSNSIEPIETIEPIEPDTVNKPETSDLKESVTAPIAEEVKEQQPIEQPPIEQPLHAQQVDLQVQPVKEKKNSLVGLVIGLSVALIAVIIALVFVIGFGFGSKSNSQVDTQIVEENNDKIDKDNNKETPKSGKETEQKDDVTVLIYMIAADLDRDAGAASQDLDEMMKADISKGINIVVQTGGTKSWSNDYLSNGKVERFTIDNNGINMIDSLGKLSMAKQQSLADFIEWGTENYPARKYHLILWDHGGGVAGGFGNDENFPDDSLYLSDIGKALHAADTHFELIGFNACLMATVETANIVKDYADYLLASEESVYANAGLNYTNYINMLSHDPDIDTLDLGMKMCDTFVGDEIINELTNYEMATMSVIKLSEMSKLMDALDEYFGELRKLMEGSDQGLNEVISARYASKSYGEDGFDEIDLLDFVNHISSVPEETKRELVTAFNHVVLYNGTYSEGVNGLSIYIPGVLAENGYCFVDELQAEGITNKDYTTFVIEMAAVLENLAATQSGENTGNGNSSDYYGGGNSQITTDSFWDAYDGIVAYENGGYQLKQGDLIKVYYDGENGYELDLSSCDIKNYNNVKNSVKYVKKYIEGTGCFMDLGYDVYCVELDDATKLGVDNSDKWFCVDGYPVPYYYVEDGKYEDGASYEIAVIPALLNGTDYIKMASIWENGENSPYIAGYFFYEGNDDELKQLKSGDYLNFVYDFYRYDGVFDHSEVNELNTYYSDGGELRLSYDNLDDASISVYHSVTDNDGNKYYTIAQVKGTEYDTKVSKETADLIVSNAAILSDMAKEVQDFLNTNGSEVDQSQRASFEEKLEACKKIATALQGLNFNDMNVVDAEVYIYYECQVYNGIAEMAELASGDTIERQDLSFTYYK